MNSKKIAKNAIISLLSAVFVMSAGLIISVVTARGLGSVEFGLLSIVMWTRTTIGMIADVGLANGVVKFISELNGRREHQVARSLTSWMLLVQIALVTPVGAALASSASIVAITLNHSELTPYFPLAALILVLSVINVFLRCSLSGAQRFDIRGIIDIISISITLSGVLLVISSGWGIYGLLLSEALVSCVQLVLFGAALIRFGIVGPLRTIASSTIRYVTGYCFGIFFLTSLDAIVWQRSEIFFLSRYSSTGQVALYGLAYSVTTMLLTTLPATIGGVLLPALSQYIGANQRDTMNSTYIAAITYMGIVIFFIAGNAIGMAEALLKFLYGSAYSLAAPTLQVLVIGAAAGALLAPGWSLLLALGKPRAALLWMVPIAVFDLGLTYILVVPLGALGAAISSTICQLIVLVATTIYLSSISNFSPPIKRIFRLMVATLPVVASTFIITTHIPGVFGLVSSAAISTVCYILALLLTRAITTSDIDLLIQVIDANSRLGAGFFRWLISCMRVVAAALPSIVSITF